MKKKKMNELIDIYIEQYGADSLRNIVLKVAAINIGSSIIALILFMFNTDWAEWIFSQPFWIMIPVNALFIYVYLKLLEHFHDKLLRGILEKRIIS